ncbi:beta strand repeat-containing protein, partial [Antarctobacter heliothermus]
MSVVQLFNRFVAVWFLALLTSAAAMAQPVFNSSVSPTTIGAGNVATLTYTIDNGGSGSSAVDAAFGTTLPAGMTFRGDPDVDASCVGAVVSATSGGTTLSFADADIAAGGVCQIVLNVMASSTGTITSGDLTSSLGNSGPASTTLTVDANAVTFDKSFSPSTVSLGGKSTLTFTITNPSASTRIGNLDFTDNLPAGLEVASPANATTNCVSAGINDTTVTATPGSSTISLDANGFAGAAGFEVLPISSSCTVTVDVKATAGGDLVNSTSLQADFVTVGSAQDTLSVTVAALNLTKDYLINPANAGGTTELEFTIANFNRFEGATDVSFTDDLSVGLAGLTYDSLLSNTCGGTVSGTGTSLISFANGTVSGGDTCAIRVLVSVPGGAVGGSYPNTTSMVAGTVGGVAVTGNAASDSLIVPAGGSAPTLTFEILEDGTFAADPVISAGDDIVLRYTITNTSTTDAASDIAVLLDPIPPLSFPLTATLPATPCGAGSSVAVVSTGFEDQGIELTGGSLAVGASCTFDVTLTTPGDLGGGTYTLVTDAVTATLAGSTVTGNSGSDSFVVGAGADVSFGKTFSGGVEPGGTATLTFNIATGAESAAVSALSFTDDLSAMLTGVTATGLPISACGGTLTGSAGDTLLTFTGGSLAGSGDSCAIPVTLNVPASAAIGDYPNTTSVLSGAASGQSFDFGVATDDLSVVGLNFTKEFLTNPVIAGETTTLRFSIENLHPTDDATITFFTDNLQTNLSGLAGTGPASLDTCGGSLSGTTFLIYTGGSVLSGQTCTIEVEVQVPAAAADGSYGNITSSLSTSFGTTDPAVDTLIVQSNLISLSKDFTDDPVAPGDAVTLQFTLTNEDPSRAASDIAFTDDLDAMLSGTTFDSVLSNTCGGTITGTATDTIDVSGVALAGGASCTLTTSLTVPGAAGLGPVDNTTSDVTATIDGLAVAGDAASDTLSVAGAVDLTFSKSFADAGVPAGGSTVLSLTVVNAGSGSVSGISFTDDLDAMLSGTVASGHAASAGCGGGGTFSGSGFLTASGYSVGVGQTCTLTATVTVPGGAALGSYTNTTSQLFISGVPTEAAVSDSLVVVPAPTFDKSFADAAIALGFSTTMTLTVDNSASIIAANSLDVTDNLPAGMVVAATPNASATCTGGTLTATAGSGTVSYTGGTVAAAATCTVSVDVTAAAAGTLVNTTGDLTSSLGNSGNASDSLTVVPQPGFAKAFSPAGINLGQSSTLTFTIDNSGSVLAASALDFTDTLPANLAVAATPNASTTCTGGTLTATGGTGTVSYTGGGLAAASSCTISVDVTPTATGALNNLSGDLTSSLGNSGTASATLTVISPEIDISGSIGGAVADGGTLDQGTPDAGAQQTLTLTISNTGSDVLTLAAAPVISGASNVVVDSVTGPLVTSVAIGGSTTVTILYTPAAGILTDPTISLPFSFDVSLGNNDVDEAPYDFTVSGTAQDVTVPSGYTVAFDQDPVNAANEAAVSFTFAGAEVGTGYAYSIASDGGGAPVTGSGTIATATDVVSGLDVSGLGDGTLTLTVALTDAAGNTGVDATDTTTKDATVPAGYTVAFDQDPVNAANETAVSFTFAGAEVGTGYAYSIASDGGGAPVTGSGTIATAADQITGIDVSGLGDGTLTLTVALTDAAGNTGADATDTTTKDATVPAGYTVAFDQDPVNAANETAVSFTFAGAEVGTGYAYSIASDGGGAPVTGSGTIATATDVVSGLDLSGLGDGTLTLTVALTDAAGNTGADATDTTTKDATVPAGYSVAFDQDPVNAANETAVSFTFAGAEVGTGYAYSIASDGGGAPVTGSGTIATAADQITGIDVSGLGDGTLTLTVALTDAAGNTGVDATDTTTKDATVPAGYTVAFDQDPVNAANEAAVSFTFAGAEVGTG